ncbi:MAG: glycosyltransferase family 39 protein [Chloroflexota bacterium]
MGSAAAAAIPRPRPGTWIALEAGLVLALLGYALAMRVWNLDAFTGSFDEGIRSEQLLLMSAGYRPFRDIFSSQGPILLDLLHPFFVWFGETLEAARSGVVALSLVALVGAWWAGRALAGPVAGVAGVVLLVLSPGFLEGSRLALAEVPTIAPALLALALVAAYRHSGRTGLLVGSALACAIALLIKPMVIHVVVPLGVALVLPRPGERIRSWRRYVSRGAAEGLAFATVVALVCGLVVLALGPAQVWDNLGAYRAGAGHTLGADWAKNLRLSSIEVGYELPGFFVVAVVGFALGLWRRTAATLIVGSWLCAVLLMFALYGDLADKHVVYVIPPLALLGALGVDVTASLLAGGVALVRSRRARTTDGPAFLDGAALLVGLLAVVIYVLGIQSLYREQRRVVIDNEKIAERRRNLDREIEIADIIQSKTQPNEWVLSDDPSAAFRARRMVIPSLVDTSGTRVDAGSLTSERAIAASEQYRPVVVVTRGGRLAKLDAFKEWLTASGYQTVRTYDGGWRVYVRGDR